MPQIDQLRFLLSSAPSLERNVIYIYHHDSRWNKTATCLKVIAQIKSKGFRLEERCPDADICGPSLFSDDVYRYVDLSWPKTVTELDKSFAEKSIERFLDAIVSGSLEGAGSFLILPARQYSSSSGPVWIENSWSCWPAVTNFATVIVEPRVSSENVEELVKNLLRLSDLAIVSRISNKAMLVDYLVKYAQGQKPTLLQLSRQIDMAILTGIDRRSGEFDVRSLQDDESAPGNTPSIGASLRSFLADPKSSNLEYAVSSLDDRLNKRSISVSDALRQVFRSTIAYMKEHDRSDNGVALWAWLLLAGKSPRSKAALIDAYLDAAIQYQSSNGSRQIGKEKDLCLDAVMRARAGGRGDESPSLDRAKADLADMLVEYVLGRSEASAPNWMLKLKLALDLERSSEGER